MPISVVAFYPQVHQGTFGPDCPRLWNRADAKLFLMCVHILDPGDLGVTYSFRKIHAHGLLDNNYYQTLQ